MRYHATVPLLPKANASSVKMFARVLCLETIKVYDGYSSLRKRLFRTLTVSKHCSKEELLLAAMKAFVVTQVLYNAHLLGTAPIEEDLQYVQKWCSIYTPQETAFLTHY